MTDQRIAIYPGSFDPVTNGHLDILGRALSLFDKVIIAIGINTEKNPLFSKEEQAEMIKDCTKDMPVEVELFKGLLVDYAKKKGVRHVIRGLRAVSDFDYEFQLATLNRNMWKDFDSVFLMTDKEYFYLSSSMIKEIAGNGGDISGYVPSDVEKRLKEKLKG